MNCNWCRERLDFSSVDNAHVCRNTLCHKYRSLIPPVEIGVVDKKQNEIDELVDMLEIMHGSFSEDMYQKPLRELETLIDKHRSKPC